MGSLTERMTSHVVERRRQNSRRTTERFCEVAEHGGVLQQRTTRLQGFAVVLRFCNGGPARSCEVAEHGGELQQRTTRLQGSAVLQRWFCNDESFNSEQILCIFNYEVARICASLYISIRSE
ncbi:putative transmembrane protein [Sesbania bispinosa]|nr:putative transmembrane protein [Sesbania bispinosa]